MKLKVVLIFLLFSFVIVFGGCGSNSVQETQETKLSPEEQAMQDRYNNAMNCLKEHKPQEAIDFLIATKGKYEKSITKYKNGEVLFNYALAMREFDKQSPGKRGMVDYYLEKIPDNYSGDLAEEIRNYKVEHLNDNQKYYKEHPLSPEEKAKRDVETDKVLAETEKVLHPLIVGDPASKALKYYGQPKRINKTGTQNGVSEQWVYDNMYIYIENGKVVAWQTQQ